MLSAQNAFAFDKLSAAQSLVYETPHLADTSLGQKITYDYTAFIEDSTMTDVATIDIASVGEDNKRDVIIDFLSDERHLTLPDFTGWRGNPVILAMLEHVAQSLGAETGGGALYFRNRIRDAMASESVEIQQSTEQWNGDDVAVKAIAFSPLTDDVFLQGTPEYRKTEITIQFSDAVPGGVLALEADAQNNGETAFNRRLVVSQ